MIEGSFGDNGELFFEIQLVALSGEDFFVEALFDTGFTDGFYLEGIERIGIVKKREMFLLIGKASRQTNIYALLQMKKLSFQRG